MLGMMLFVMPLETMRTAGTRPFVPTVADDRSDEATLRGADMGNNSSNRMRNARNDQREDNDKSDDMNALVAEIRSYSTRKKSSMALPNL